MGGIVELSGPDLEQGVEESEIKAGSCLLGHARGEPVVLVRDDEQLHAVGAVCTHFSGPLHEGVVVDGTIRCPWHHACFDLKSGAPAAPAFEPIPVYRLVRDGSRVKVGPRVDVPAPAAIANPGRVVIVGAGAAGAMAAEALRRFGHAGAIVLLGEEATGPVDRTNLSKDYLAGEAPEEWMVLRDASYYEEHNIDFRRDTQVVELHCTEHEVALASGEKLAFDALIVASGAEPVRLDLPGGQRMRTLRTLADARAVIDVAQPGARAVVIGSSFIGLEVAASLRHRGVTVDVVGRELLPLERVLGKELGQLILDVHQAGGVRFHLGRSPASIGPTSVTLDDGTVLPADFVVGGVGVRPRTQLAERAGLQVEAGIVVDAQFRAAPDVYAIGDVARYPDARSGKLVRIEHWMVAQRQGETVARVLLGQKPRPYVPFFWSVHHDLTINYVGHAPGFDRVEIDGDVKARDATVRYFLADRLLAAATVGRDKEALQIALELEE